MDSDLFLEAKNTFLVHPLPRVEAVLKLPQAGRVSAVLPLSLCLALAGKCWILKGDCRQYFLPCHPFCSLSGPSLHFSQLLLEAVDSTKVSFNLLLQQADPHLVLPAILAWRPS